MERWQGRIAIVTGASSGIGAAVAQKLVENGLIVAGLARRGDRLKELGQKLGKNFHSIECDVTKEDNILDAFKWVDGNLGVPTVLVNNAGVNINNSILEVKSEEIRQMNAVNLEALILCTREAMKCMIAHNIDYGHIININSVVGHMVFHEDSISKFAPYTATKHGARAFAECTRKELAHRGLKIKTTNISPGLVNTEMGVEYQAFPMLEAEDVAAACISVLATPPLVQITELTISTIGEESLPSLESLGKQAQTP